MHKALRGIVSGVVLLFGLSTGALAQREVAVSGTVTDITGGVLPSAEVTAIHETTAEATMVFAGETGKYQLTGFATGVLYAHSEHARLSNGNPHQR